MQKFVHDGSDWTTVTEIHFRAGSVSQRGTASKTPVNSGYYYSSMHMTLPKYWFIARPVSQTMWHNNKPTFGQCFVSAGM